MGGAHCRLRRRCTQPSAGVCRLQGPGWCLAGRCGACSRDGAQAAGMALRAPAGPWASPPGVRATRTGLVPHACLSGSQRFIAMRAAMPSLLVTLLPLLARSCCATRPRAHAPTPTNAHLLHLLQHAAHEPRHRCLAVAARHAHHQQVPRGRVVERDGQALRQLTDVARVQHRERLRHCTCAFAREQGPGEGGGAATRERGEGGPAVQQLLAGAATACSAAGAQREVHARRACTGACAQEEAHALQARVAWRGAMDRAHPKQTSVQGMR